MDYFLQVPDEDRQPPEGVRLREVKITPYPNGNKVKINLELSPFKIKPNIEVTITDASGKQAAHTSILEAMLHKMELVMHIRTPMPGGQYRIETKVYYQRLPEPSEIEVDIPIPEPMIVDRHEATFTLPLLEP